ncbi:MAG: glycosyltransferase family 4 protein [Actinomycetota bacterium]
MTPLIYVLQNGNLDGMEQMALATLDGLRDEFKPYLFAPEGRVIKEAQQMDFVTQSFSGAIDLTMKLWSVLNTHKEFGFIATNLTHSYSLITLNKLYRRKIMHLHVVSGGIDDYSSFGGKSRLNYHDVSFIAVSKFVKERLIAYETRQERIRVIENFLSQKRIDNLPQSQPFTKNGVNKIIVQSRLEPMKRVDLLLDALDFMPSLATLEFTVFGTGSQFETLKQRAAGRHPNVTFAGFHENIAEAMANADLFLHLCPIESSGLTILEALAANLPVLVADSGSTGSMISNNINGFTFHANDAEHLARRLSELANAPFEFLNVIAKGGKHLLNIRFSADHGLERYRRLLTFPKTAVEDLTKGKLIM